MAPNESIVLGIYVSLGVLMLAMGGATLNSLQEQIVDSRLRRTANRPLTQKQISSCYAGYQATSLVTLGSILLYTSTGNLLASFLGFLALVIYNGIYTRLKQRTILAIVPGAICGAIPPVIGYVGAGGDGFSYMALLLFALLFLWQVPHFLLILLQHRDDYLLFDQPSFVKMLSEQGIRKLCSIWCFALSLVMMLFIALETVSLVQRGILLTNGLSLLTIAFLSLRKSTVISYRNSFVILNLILFIHMATLTTGSFLN